MVMESFRSLQWNVPVEAETDFATAEEFKSSSITYKILHGSFKAELSSDSSDEQVIYKKKSRAKKANKKKKKVSNKDKCTDSVGGDGKKIVDGVRYSAFSPIQHASYVEMLCAVQTNRATFPPELMAMKEAVENEQKEFIEHMRELWKTAYQKHNVLMDGAKRYTEDKWKSQLKRVKSYPQFYSSLRKIPLVYPADCPEIKMDPVEVLLEMGIVPKFYVPNDQISTISVDYSTMLLLNAPCPDDDDTLLHVPVSSDRNAEILAVKEQADIVISSSSLKCIADNISSKFDKVWSIPIVVKQYSVKDGSSSKSHKVVYVDKRFAAKAMNASERNLWCHKVAIKCLMCHYRDPTSFR